MQRHQRDELFQSFHDCGIDQGRLGECHPPMNHAVTYGEWHKFIGEMLVSPMRQVRERFRMPDAFCRVAE